MARRRHDFYETSRALTLSLLVRETRILFTGPVLECCAGHNAITDVLREGLLEVYTNELQSDGEFSRHEHDFHLDATEPESWEQFPDVGWVITNPPYNQALDILEHAFGHAEHGVAMLLRLSFLEPTLYRGTWLEQHQDNLSKLIIFGSPRPSYTGKGTDSVTTAWMIWRKDPFNAKRIMFAKEWVDEDGTYYRP